MTHTNPAATLRAAADMLRALATAASTDTHGRPSATWTVRYCFTAPTGEPRREHGCYLHTEGHVPLLRGSSGSHGRGSRPHLHVQHAEYIAAMDPTVGLALADWLHDEATYLEHLETTDADGLDEPEHALRVARLILGEDHAPARTGERS
ncbi:hypothetical protein CTZ27_37015 [Streptomyces griseocarneus]|nr:hypothetical protein CTZ27_37015 [Streptomyces griseocarneus]